MKKVLLFSLAIMAAAFLNVCAAPIDSYQKLTSAMNTGKRLWYVINFKEITGEPIGLSIYFYIFPNSLGLFPATETTPEHVVFSDFRHIFSDVVRFQMLKIRIYSDHRIEIEARWYDPSTYKEVAQHRIYNTTLNQGFYINVYNESEKDEETAQAEKDYTPSLLLGPPAWPFRPH